MQDFVHQQYHPYESYRWPESYDPQGAKPETLAGIAGMGRGSSAEMGPGMMEVVCICDVYGGFQK